MDRQTDGQKKDGQHKDIIQTISWQVYKNPLIGEGDMEGEQPHCMK